MTQAKQTELLNIAMPLLKTIARVNCKRYCIPFNECLGYCYDVFCDVVSEERAYKDFLNYLDFRLREVSRLCRNSIRELTSGIHTDGKQHFYYKTISQSQLNYIVRGDDEDEFFNQCGSYTESYIDLKYIKHLAKKQLSPFAYKVLSYVLSFTWYNPNNFDPVINPSYKHHHRRNAKSKYHHYLPNKKSIKEHFHSYQEKVAKCWNEIESFVNSIL